MEEETLSAYFILQSLDFAEVLGPRRALLSINAQWVEVLNAQYRHTANGPITYGTLRDPDSGLSFPLRAGVRIDFGSRRVERLEMELTAASHTCSVELAIGNGVLRAGPETVYMQPLLYPWRVFATKAVVGTINTWLGVLSGSGNVDTTYISAPNTNTQGIYVGFDTTAVGGVPQGIYVAPGANITIKGLPPINIWGGVLNEYLNILRLAPQDSAGTIAP